MNNINKYINIKSIDNIQYFITITFNEYVENQYTLIREIYYKIYDYLKKNNIEIFHERIFGSYNFFDKISNLKKDILNRIDTDSSYIIADPFWGNGISGINIYGISRNNVQIENVVDNNKIVGKMWRVNDTKGIIINRITDTNNSHSDFQKNYEIFSTANRILKKYNFNFKDVIRTWCYIPKIDKQYCHFNKARNRFFEEVGLLKKITDYNDYEKIYLPASTGIGCSNPYSNSTLMDLYAIVNNDNTYSINNENGNKQKSAFRYGAAFSRSIIFSNKTSTHLFLSGTASIDENGNTVNIGNIDMQIEKTFDVIKSLISTPNIHLNQLMEGTIFIKNKDYAKSYLKYLESNHIDNFPAIICIADVCRPDLLFEMDGIFAK